MPRTPKPFTPVVRRRLRRVRNFILAHPSKFGMQGFVASSRKAMQNGQDLNAPKNFRLSTECGTTCCIAGWMHAATPKAERMGSEAETMDAALGDMSLAHRVMIALQWPEPFRSQFDAAKTARAEARVAARRIDHLLETGE